MDKCVVYLSEGGYKISTVLGKVLYHGQKFSTLNEATAFCDSEKLDYFIA